MRRGGPETKSDGCAFSGSLFRRKPGRARNIQLHNQKALALDNNKLQNSSYPRQPSSNVAYATATYFLSVAGGPSKTNQALYQYLSCIRHWWAKACSELAVLAMMGHERLKDWLVSLVFDRAGWRGRSSQVWSPRSGL